MSETPLIQLAPHRPLEPSDPLYVPRPFSSGDELARQVLAGFSRIAVVGPAGVGKSTELAAAAKVLSESRPTVLVRVPGVAHLTEGLQAVANLLAKSAGTTPTTAIEDSIVLAIRALAAQHSGGRPVLLFDGLERVSDRAMCLGLVRRLHELAEEADVVFVVSPMMTTGPEAYEFIEDVVARRVFEVYPLPVLVGSSFNDNDRGVGFFVQILMRRWPGVTSLPNGQAVSICALILSGGLPRGYLQLVQDTLTFDRLYDASPFTRASLESSAREQASSLRRLLRDGDLPSMEELAGTEGTEMEVDRLVRLLSHGLVLRYRTGTGAEIHPHPLLTQGWTEVLDRLWAEAQ